MAPALITGIKVTSLDNPTRDKRITWSFPVNNPTIVGFNVYRSEVSYADFEKVNSSLIPVTENEYIDHVVPVVPPGIFEWWYKITAMNAMDEESDLSSTLPAPDRKTDWFSEPPIQPDVPTTLSEQNLTFPSDALKIDPHTREEGDSGNLPIQPNDLQFLPKTHVNPRWFLEVRRRSKWILEMGGIPIILLKRRWSGTLCPLYDNIRGSHRTLSSPLTPDPCFGTNFVGGYHTPIKILISIVNPAIKKVSRKDAGMWMEMEPKSWSLWEPNLLDRDVILRVDTGERFELTDVTRTIWRGMVLRQMFDLKLLEPSNIIYRVPGI